LLSSEVAYIIGNGLSRSGFDIEKLIGSGTVWGCNALYRDWEDEGNNRRFMLPDYLVAIDAGIISEIESSEFPSDRFIVPPRDEQYEPAEANPNRPRSNAGMVAMIESIRKGATTLICFGFDFLLPGNVTNMYDKTDNYGMKTRATPQDNKGRCRYLQWFVNQNSNVNFFFSFPEFKTSSPIGSGVGDWPQADNVHYCTHEQLLANLDGEL
jgi:hypothetical protein